MAGTPTGRYDLRKNTESPNSPNSLHKRHGKNLIIEDQSDQSSSLLDDSISNDENSNSESELSFKKESSQDISNSANRKTVSTKRTQPSVNKDQHKRKVKPQTPVIPEKGVQKPNAEEKKETETYAQKLMTMVLITFLACLFVFCLHYLTPDAKEPEKPIPISLYEKFKKDYLNNLKKNFPSQDKLFWKIVSVPLKRIFTEEDPEYPAVLLFAVPKGPLASLTGSCLARHLTDSLNQVHGLDGGAFIDIDRDLRRESASKDKMELDEKLIHFYSAKASRGVVVDHFEKLFPMTTLLFHGYCDGDHAPYKNVSMTLVLHTDINQDVITNDKYAVNNYLQDLWKKELDADKIPPLISRIANNVAIVTAEDSDSLKKLCPLL